MIDNFLKLVDEMDNFQAIHWLGVTLGGMAPICIMLLIQSVLSSGVFIPKTTVIVWACFGSLVLFQNIIMPLYLSYPHRRVGNLFFSFTTIEAALCLIFVHIAVLCSGGVTGSPIAFTYLYIPAVIGNTYGRGYELYFALIILAASYITILIFGTGQVHLLVPQGAVNQKTISNLVRTPQYCWLLFLFWQLFFSVLIVSRPKCKAVFSKSE